MNQADCVYVSTAIAVAAMAHGSQLRRGSTPYVLHPIALVQMAIDEGCSDPEFLAGLALHDVLEDTSLKEEDLLKTFSHRTVHMVQCMTKIEGESPEDYYLRVESCEDSLRGKIYDLKHNIKIDNLVTSEEEEFTPNLNKYLKLLRRFTKKIKEIEESKSS